MGGSWKRTALQPPGVLDWTDVAAVSVSPFHTVAVKTDGTVIASGDIQYGQCEVEDWQSIAAVTAGERHTVALTTDGKLLATGDNEAGQCSVEGWTLWEDK